MHRTPRLHADLADRASTSTPTATTMLVWPTRDGGYGWEVTFPNGGCVSGHDRDAALAMKRIEKAVTHYNRATTAGRS